VNQLSLVQYFFLLLLTCDCSVFLGGFCFCLLDKFFSFCFIIGKFPLLAKGLPPLSLTLLVEIYFTSEFSSTTTFVFVTSNKSSLAAKTS